MRHKLAIVWGKILTIQFPWENFIFHVAAAVSLHSLGTSVALRRGKKQREYGVFWHACLRNTLGHFWNKCRLTYTVTSPQTSQCGKGEKNRKTFWGWRMSKNGNTARVFSAASVLNSLAYLWFSSKTVTHCREGRLALVMGFNRKCGVTSERGGRDGGAGREGGGNGAQTQLRLPLDADKPLLSPDRGS